MRRNCVVGILVQVVACLLLNQIVAQPVPPAGKKWSKVSMLSDEFNSWDSNKWRKSLWNYGVPVQMRAENSGVTNGKLWIKATLDDGAERWFETSRVMSNSQISYPMYTECSMKTAHISAYNTYWMNNGDSDNRDEFDICENNSKPYYTSQNHRQTTMYSQYFLVVNSNVERAADNFDNKNLSDTNSLKGVKWNEAYHTLGAWWIDKNTIQFYLNGEKAGKVTTTRNFTRSLNIIWDLWTIDKTWSGGIATQSDLLNDDINTMYVDWIHTYSLVDDPDYDPGTDPDPDPNPDPALNLTQAIGATYSVDVYPNPANNYLNVYLQSHIADNAMLHIYDRLGGLVKSEQLSEVNQQISLNAIPPGIYIVHIENGEYFKSELLIKQ